MTEEMQKMFNELPEQMREATIRHKAAIIRCYKARIQFDLWKAELSAAEQIRKAEEYSYGLVAMRWNPQTNKMDELETK